MTKKYYTSLEFSELLKENGCELESTNYWLKNEMFRDETPNNPYRFHIAHRKIPKEAQLKNWKSYDILWDICVRYAKEFFGEELVCARPCKSFAKKKLSYCDEKEMEDCDIPCPKKSYEIHSHVIFKMLQQDKSQEEIEKYIWDNTVFNKKNKEKKWIGKM